MEMRIGEFAAALGLSVDTVRRLERRGLVFGERDWCGHRRFSEEDLDRARETLFARKSTASDRGARERSETDVENDATKPSAPGGR
jgi:DNA-binding transcriptional MerR regulator